MKKQTLYRIALSILFLCFGKLPASVHSLEQLMTVQIPFDFQVGEKLLPAGKYVIQRDSQTPRLLLIQGAEQKTLGRGVSYALFKSKAERRLAQLAEAKTIRATTNDATNN